MDDVTSLLVLARELPQTAILIYLLYSSHKTRLSSMQVMSAMVDRIMDVVKECCGGSVHRG